MRKTRYFPYFLLILFLFSILSISKDRTQKIRGVAVLGVAPLWSNLNITIGKFFYSYSKEKNYNLGQNEDIQLENSLLKDQIDGVYEWLTFDQRIDEQLDRLKQINSKTVDELYWKEFFRRRSEELKHILEIELQSIPAKIIFREPASWSSSAWINVGEDDNEALGRLIIGKNSPIVVGDALVGVVEYVGKKHSRIRFITDSGLVPSVRALRGNSQDRALLQIALDFYERIYTRDDLFEDPKKRNDFCILFNEMIKTLKKENVDYYLAKGELHGSSFPLWRSYGQKLCGVGFNYDYDDEEGSARELTSGKPLDMKFDFLTQILLERGDMLITTGMDGIFPAGLKVGIISKIKKLAEAGYFYEIEALPAAIGLCSLNMVFVMPPLGFEKI